jgi:class 3 adenylate cyclase
MTFEEMLQQTIDILQHRGRISYRALKRQFDIDDDYLADLKEEILYAYPQVMEEGRGLAWIEADATPSALAPATATPERPATQEPSFSAASSAPEAERRQLTVMFCDLAASTQLSQQLDPEDLRDVIRAYQETAVAVAQRFGGYAAQYLGDGLLLYFGWPQAHEDDAQRGVRAGLGIVETLTTTLNPRLEREHGVRLVVRIGLHTGPVVVGEMGGGGRHEQLALGETTNIAARLEGLATPNTVVISNVTARLVASFFTLDDLGSHALRGVAEPMQVFGVVRERTVAEREAAAEAAGASLLVGRDKELALLLERWTQSKAGGGPVGTGQWRSRHWQIAVGGSLTHPGHA